MLKKLCLLLLVVLPFTALANKRKFVELPNDQASLNELGIYFGSWAPDHLNRTKLIFPASLSGGFEFVHLTLVIMDEDERVFHGRVQVCTLSNVNLTYHYSRFLFSADSSKDYGLYLSYLNKNTDEVRTLSLTNIKNLKEDVFFDNPIDKIFSGEEYHMSDPTNCMN